jgi:predicted transcriptional regulator of viral defense system
MTPKNMLYQVLDIVKKKGMLRPRDLDRYGIPRIYLSRLCDRGLLQRINRGLYVLPEAEQTEHHTLAEACKRSPNGVICLLSALRFHQITTQAPFEIWMALKGTAWHPKIDRPRIRFVRFSGPAFDTGIERHKIEGVSVKVYNPAKTVADCFKYRNKIGLDVAIEALRECRREKKCANDELWEYAKVCRVSSVMKPDMEAMV